MDQNRPKSAQNFDKKWKILTTDSDRARDSTLYTLITHEFSLGPTFSNIIKVISTIFVDHGKIQAILHIF